MVRGSPARAPFTSRGIGRCFAPPSRGLFCFADSSAVFAWRSGMKPGGVGPKAACTPPPTLQTSFGSDEKHVSSVLRIAHDKA